MIKAMLQVTPANRPTTKQLIHMPVFIAKYNEIRESKAKDFDDEEQIEGGLDLLGTIRVPKNLRLLTERLPKSNFEKAEKMKEKTVLEEVKAL